MSRDPSGFSNISTTYQRAYQTYDGNVQVQQVGDRMWKIVPRGGAELFEKSKQAALERALQLAASAALRKKTRGQRRVSKASKSRSAARKKTGR